MASDVPCPNLPTNVTNPQPDELATYFSTIFYSGYTITFVASLITFAYDYDASIGYMNDIAPVVERDLSELSGTVHFYVKRAEMKYHAHWFPRDLVSDDLKLARTSADNLLKMARDFGSSSALGLTANYGQVVSYLELVRAGIINFEIFSIVRDWLEGHRLSADEIRTLQILATELQTWIDAQAPHAEAEKPKDPTGQRIINLVAAAHDTRALAEMAIGVSKQDTTGDRCARILEHLTKSKGIYDWSSRLQQPWGLSRASDPHSFSRLIEAHYQLYDSICGN
jgi:hypothetical protein